MELNQLKIFIQVAQESSFDRVAEQNYVSQRAVSRQMKRLEEDLGVNLFFRKSNHISLTPAGEYFARKAEQYLNSLSDTINTLQVIEKNSINNLHIGYFSVFDGVLLRDQILNYRKNSKNPQINFSIVEESVEHILADLDIARLDCGYINHYGHYNFLNKKHYKFVDVYQGKMMLGISKKDELSQKEFITEKDLVGRELLYYSGQSSNYMRDTFLATLGNDIGKYHVKRVPSIEELMIDCSLGFGLAYVTEGLYEKFMVRDPNIVFKEIKSKKIDQNYTMQLVYRPDNHSEALKSFIRSIKSL